MSDRRSIGDSRMMRRVARTKARDLNSWKPVQGFHVRGRELFPVRPRGEILVWWLQPAAVHQLVGEKTGDRIDLLDQLRVPPYIAEVVRSMNRPPAGEVTVPTLVSSTPIRIKAEARQIATVRRCHGIAFLAQDAPKLYNLPGFVTDLSLDVVVPRPSEREWALDQRIGAYVEFGCVCGRPVDYILNRPVVLERGIGRSISPKVIIRCEACWENVEEVPLSRNRVTAEAIEAKATTTRR